MDSAQSSSAGDQLQRDSARDVYELLFRGLAIGLYQAAPAGRLIRANPKLAEMLGWASPEALVAEVEDIGSQLHQNRDHWFEMLTNLERRGETHLVTPMRRRDGQTIWVSEAAFAVRGADGWTKFILGALTDVTELIRTQEALLAAERSHRELFENATEGIYRSDPAGRILSANPAFVRLLGYDNERDMLLDLNERGIILYADPKRLLEFRQQIAVTGRLSGFESELVLRDGRRIWISENARTVWDRTGRVLWYEGTIKDITDRKRAEAALRSAEEAAEHTNEARARFLAATTHDVRQPYQAMRLLLHALACRQSDPQSQALARRLDEAMTTGENLLNALLDMSTLEGGMVRPHVASFPMASVIDRLHGEFSPQAAARGMTLRYVRCTASVRSDPVLLERIVRNLVLNAIRHGPSGRILLGCRRAADSVRLQIWDTGPGIPPDKLDEIFEAFAQYENEERDSSRGHGLGLAIVKGLVRVLGHEIAVRSTVGRGTVFSVRLPAADDERPSAGLRLSPETAESAPAGPRRSVLVIEDEPAQRMSLSLLLQDWGYLVRSAADLTSALRELEQWGEQPSFVVSDFRLPGGRNGVEAIEEIGRLMGRRIPGIILTGDTDPARLREARRSGCILMHKPVSLGSLRHAVASLGSQNERV